MALTYNNVDPTTITYSANNVTTDITVLKYGTTAVWGKHFTLSVSAGTGSTITVNRTSSPNQHASTGNLSNGATIYYGDTLVISYSVETAYNIGTHTVDGTTFTSGTGYTVSGNMSVITTATVKSYTLTLDAGVGASITANRTSSPYKGASTGNLSSSATIYYGDTLTISYSISSGYTVNTHTVNGSTFTSGTSYTVSSNIYVAVTATYVPSWHTVYNNASGTQTNYNANSYGSGSCTAPNVVSGRPTKITGVVHFAGDLTKSGYGSGWTDQGGAGQDVSFSSSQTNFTVYYPNKTSPTVVFSTPTSNGAIPVNRTYGDPGLGIYVGCQYIKITKIEQYY